MQPYNDLTHIYVLIKEEFTDHWYLMVILIEDHLIFHFDSNIQTDKVESRKETIINVFSVIAQMVSTECYPQDYVNGYFQVDGWDFAQPRRLPQCGKNSAVWVLIEVAGYAGRLHSTYSTIAIGEGC
ncbi:hypothetical protein GLYMA_05G077850v4 [Glycine max]|nr:hypothetical protein GLYMA_05G077850v4 [Glycine max]KAH1133290.1 hypothetical protein GYH30_011926 [Glycine max]